MGNRAMSGARVPKTSRRFSIQSVCSDCFVSAFTPGPDSTSLHASGRSDNSQLSPIGLPSGTSRPKRSARRRPPQGTLHADGLEDVGNHGLRRMAVPGWILSFSAAEPWFIEISSSPLEP